MKIIIQQLCIVGVCCVSFLQAAQDNHQPTIPDRVINGTTYTVRRSVMGMGDVVQVSSTGDAIADAAFMDELIRACQAQAADSVNRPVPTFVAVINAAQLNNVQFGDNNVQLNHGFSHGVDLRAVVPGRSIHLTSIAVPANSAICAGDYNYRGPCVCRNGDQINGNANLISTSTQKAVLTSCIIRGNLQVTASTCDLVATRVNGDCRLDSCTELVLRNNSSVDGDIIFATVSGKVFTDRNSKINGLVVNGTIEKQNT